MNEKLQQQKELLSPPGDTIQETLDHLNMSQAELAKRMGRPKEKINDLIKGREPLTRNTALLLERVLGIPVSFWMNRENEYREELMRIEQQEFLENSIEWARQFPLANLKKLGYLPNTTKQTEIVEALLKFFGVGSPDQWNKTYLDNRVSAAFRVSQASTHSPHAISAWLRIGELKAIEMKLPAYNSQRFTQYLSEIKTIAFSQPENFKDRLQSICAKAGVAVVFTRDLPKAPVSGATWWINQNPIIQLSGRYKTNDHFWFAFFHEAAHILKHSKKEIFLENIKGSKIDEQKEREANLFAQKSLLPKTALSELKSKMIDPEIIQEYARQFHCHPGIIVGQLQHEKALSYAQFNDLKEKIELFE